MALPRCPGRALVFKGILLVNFVDQIKSRVSAEKSYSGAALLLLLAAAIIRNFVYTLHYVRLLSRPEFGRDFCIILVQKLRFQRNDFPPPTMVAPVIGLILNFGVKARRHMRDRRAIHAASGQVAPPPRDNRDNSLSSLPKK